MSAYVFIFYINIYNVLKCDRTIYSPRCFYLQYLECYINTVDIFISQKVTQIYLYPVEISSYCTTKYSVFDFDRKWTEGNVSFFFIFSIYHKEGKYIACTDISNNGWNSKQVWQTSKWFYSFLRVQRTTQTKSKEKIWGKFAIIFYSSSDHENIFRMNLFWASDLKNF